jgi:hypothetical protein
MTTVDRFFESFKSNENIIFNKVEDKYFNGQFFSPLLKYYMTFNFEGGKIQLYYEIQITLFNQPTVTIGAFGDKHRCSLQCFFVSNNKMAAFEIEKRGLLQMIFNPKPDKYHIIKTKDAELLKKLLENIHLNNVYKIAETTSEFSPSITGKADSSFNNTYLINVQFGNKTFHEEALHSIIAFCKSMVLDNTDALMPK